MQIIIFDDEKRNQFFPITQTRPTGDLRVGILKLRQRLISFFDVEKTSVVVSEDLEMIYKERHPDWSVNFISEDSVLINSRVKMNGKLAETILTLSPNTKMINQNNEVIAAKITGKRLHLTSKEISTEFNNLMETSVTVETWSNLWEMINSNAEYIKQDFENYFYDQDNTFETEMGVTVLNPYQIWIGKDAVIKPGVVLDATDGPIIIDENATIMANSVIMGPVYIGKNSKIKALAKIYEGTSIGPTCKVGGEVEETIIQAYSNKQHDGFLGHSYLGEWVNLGADTNNSDLKNNYKSVKSFYYPSKQKENTGFQFLGSIIGDHTKTGINSTINTGTLIGIGCNLYGRDVFSDFIPSFSWGEMTSLQAYKLERFLETANVVKKRRNLHLSDSEKELYTKISNHDLSFHI